MKKQLQHYFLVIISLITTLGVFMHDGRVDGATLVALNFSNRAIGEPDVEVAAKIRTFLDTDEHTHPDHNAAKNLLNSFAYRSPSVPPRDEDKHKLSSHHIDLGGRHAFDNENLPVVG